MYKGQIEGNEISSAWRGHLSHQFLHRMQGVWPVRGKEVEPGRHALEQLQFFSSEKIILLFDFFSNLAPFFHSTQLTVLTCFWPTHVVGSWSGHTPSVGQSHNLQGVGEDMLLVWLVLNSPLSQCQCSSQETEIVTTWGPKVTTLPSSCAPCNKISACSRSRSSRRPTMEKCHRAPRRGFVSLHGRNGTERPHLGKILPGVMFSPPLTSIQGSVHRLS